MAATISITGSVSISNGGSFTVTWSGLDQIINSYAYGDGAYYSGPWTIIINQYSDDLAASSGLFYANGERVEIVTNYSSGSETFHFTSEDVKYNNDTWGGYTETWVIRPYPSVKSDNVYSPQWGQNYDGLFYVTASVSGVVLATLTTYYTIRCYINGSWQDSIVRYFDGINWIDCVAKYYNGSGWQDCSF